MNSLHRELIELYLQDSCTEEQLRQILSLVKSNTHFRQDLAEAGRLQGLLSAVKYDNYEGLGQRVLRCVGEMGQHTLEDQIMDQLCLAEPQKITGKPRLNFYLWAGIVTQVIIIVGLIFSERVFFKGSTLASLYSESGQACIIRDGEELPVTASLRLLDGDSIRVDDKGDLTIIWNDSTVMEFKDRSAAGFKLANGAKKIIFQSGQLKANVVKQPQGKSLVIETPNSLATVVGTKFQFKVNQLESMLAVQRGVVELTRKIDGQKVAVGAHEYAIASPVQAMQVSKIDKPVYRSHEVNLDTPEKRVEIVAEINGSSKLYLVVHSGEDGIAYDHAAWLYPRLEDATGRELSLVDLKWEFADSEWGHMGVGLDALGKPLSYNDKVYPKAIGTHALSVIEYTIPSGYRFFKAVGVISDSGSRQKRSLSSVVFEVYTDLPRQHYRRIKLSKQGK